MYSFYFNLKSNLDNARERLDNFSDKELSDLCLDLNSLIEAIRKVQVERETEMMLSREV